MPVDQSKNKRMMINVPHLLALEIEAAAELDRRSMSSWILKLVDEKLESMPEAEQARVCKLMKEKWNKLPEKTQEAASLDWIKYLQEHDPDQLAEMLGAMEKES